MRDVEFRGSSDDTFGWYEPKTRRGDDHDDCANSKLRSFLVDSPSTGKVIVAGVYGKCPGATWAVGMSPADEDVPLPPWAVRPVWSVDGYTTVLHLEVPDDTTITLVSIDGEKPESEDG